MNNNLPSLFEKEQLGYLYANFRLTKKPAADQWLSISSGDLLDPDKCADYLNRLDTVFPSYSKTVKASLFGKRYSFMIIASSLYAMTMYNRTFDYSIVNCRIESEYRDGTWLPNLRLTDWNVTEPASGQRETWRETVVANVFAGHLGKVWRALSDAANISQTVLWENAAVYVYWLYEKRMGEEADEWQRSRMREDYDYLLNRAPAACFGLGSNPLARFNSAKCKVGDSEQPVRVRVTCCLYYQTSPTQSCCSVCPRSLEKTVEK